MPVDWFGEFVGNRLTVFLTLCFAFIGAVNVIMEIAKSIAKIHRATLGKTRIVCWKRNDGTDEERSIVYLWRLTNRSTEPICVIADALQIKGMEGTYTEAGDHCVRKIALDDFCAIPSNALGPHYVLRSHETTRILPGGEHVCWCPDKRLWMVAEMEGLPQSLKVRVAFVTSEDKVMHGRWQKARKR